MIKKGFFAIFFIFLTACSNQLTLQSLPLQHDKVKIFKITQQNPKQDSLLTVQFAPQQWRWIQTDPLGAPLARLVLDKQGWHNDGFIMPNPQAQSLFSALAVALNPINPPFIVTKDGENYSHNGKFLWQISQINTNNAHFMIRLDDHSQWIVQNLDEK